MSDSDQEQRLEEQAQGFWLFVFRVAVVFFAAGVLVVFIGCGLDFWTSVINPPPAPAECGCMDARP